MIDVIKKERCEEGRKKGVPSSLRSKRYGHHALEQKAPLKYEKNIIFWLVTGFQLQDMGGQKKIKSKLYTCP